MKKILIIILCLILSGCAKEIDNQAQEYMTYLKKISSFKQVSEKLPCDVNVYLDKLTDDEVMYRLVIDNPKESMYKLKVVINHNKKTGDIYPSSGIFEKPLNLIPSNVDLNNNNVKGIILIGYIPYLKELSEFKATFRGVITYYNINNELKILYFSRQI